MVTNAPADTLAALEQVEPLLAVAVESMTPRQIFETGWRLTDALTSVRAAMYSLRSPMPEDFYKGMGPEYDPPN